MKNEQRRGSKGGLGMLFDMDTLKRRGSKSSSNGAVPQLLVTLSPESTKRTKTSSKQRRLKIAIMGKSGVGKSALVVRYITKRYIGEYGGEESRVETQMELDDENVLIEMLDTCKSTDEKLSEHINWADGFILVFSITDYWSLYEVARLTSIIKQIKDEDKVPIIIFSNQYDMEKQRRVTKSEATQFLNDLGKPVFHTSAAHNYDSVRKAFEEASLLVYKWKFPAGKPRSRSSSFSKVRSRSGSIMEPLREAFMRLHCSSEDDIKEQRRSRPVSTADIDEIKKVKPEGKRHLISTYLSIPGSTKQKSGRDRSHSFA